MPEEVYGTKGVTEIYLARKEGDRLLHTYEMYSRQIYLAGLSGRRPTVYAVLTGPWPRGHQASAGHLALAFYKNDRLLRSYSTLDLAGAPENVTASIGHYRVIKWNLGTGGGFHRIAGSNDFVFEIETVDGRHLRFDAGTGRLMTEEEEDVSTHNEETGE